MGITKIAQVSAYVGNPHRFRFDNRVVVNRGLGGSEFDAIYRNELDKVVNLKSPVTGQLGGDLSAVIEQARVWSGHTSLSNDK
jgi:hypothetical protein